MFAGGLSYRSADCDQVHAWRNSASQLHAIGIPEAAGVRGISAAEVAFTGRPTADGATDTATIVLPREDTSLPVVRASGSTGASTGWIDCPRTCQGVVIPQYDQRFDPGVAWYVETTGADSVDVASFTVSVRYLAVR